mmetsp:Transcript_40368/g.89637  ORF Transcript_40368/g.89637 Transcript_40368/m.89637 type:complete len:721 (+) Transcript_40368:71-2233(+)|eukprot:CAMPEP_0202921400 /NCGR_PEP_ID=MMETSP1392-20130828/77374_1 /ASSEMBLY_ACC=CAM_ASM_000868 /TAXON_ID=225041 /ORGANISM="Chlamydomonas chlamydogama, Strain SAG 11-48b" /LENGTH=720 /DNA_ID=CAMNT_0049614971 /DNA_START=48 /DNA_END=2210 /DNA_ORIENTATION=+
MVAPEIDRFAIAKELFPRQPGHFPLDDFDIEDVVLPDDDDMGILSDDDDNIEQEVTSETGFGSVIVVGNLPVVPQEKYEKLAGVVKKIYSQIGEVREGGLYMPVDEKTGMSKGFAFVEFATPQEAQAAREHTNGYKLDKNHTFAVNMFDDFDKYSKVPDQYQAPEIKEFKPAENLHTWMTDKLGRDQFVLRAGDETIVLWNDGKRGRCDPVYQRQFWTESFVQWSPMGNLLTTLHRQGVAVWGGDGWQRLTRFSHANVRLIDYSPNEKYMVTYSAQEPTGPRDNATVTFNIFDVRTGKKLRVFEGTAEEYAIGAGAGGALRWPVYKWAGGKEDLYFARISKTPNNQSAISVYQAPEMGLLDKKSVKMDNVQDFEWSPSEPILAAYTVEQGSQPARIVLVKIPERTEIRQKQLYSVSEIKLFWHPQGNYLGVKVDRYTKTKKNTYTSFELFSIRDKDIPLEVMELDKEYKNDKIITFAWEPKGHRFAIVHGEGGNARPHVSFYSMRDEKGRLAVKKLSTLTAKACNAIAWSPQGRNIVLAGFKNFNGQLEFFNVDEMETMATAEHFMATDVDWDPTGRYITTSVTSAPMENGFKIWSFQGKLLYEMPKDRLYQFSWRPRLPSLLPPEKEQEIQKNLKQYSKRYDEEDEALLMQADADVLQERQKLHDEWSRWVESKREFVALADGFRKKMYGDRWEEKEFTMQRATVEQVLESKEEPYIAK